MLNNFPNDFANTQMLAQSAQMALVEYLLLAFLLVVAVVTILALLAVVAGLIVEGFCAAAAAAKGATPRALTTILRSTPAAREMEGETFLSLSTNTN
jgi:hypothetical protein